MLNELVKTALSVLSETELYEWKVFGELFLPVNRELCENGFGISPPFEVYRFKAYSPEEYFSTREFVIKHWNELREQSGGLYVRRYPILEFNVTEQTPEEYLPEKVEWIFSFRIKRKNLII